MVNNVWFAFALGLIGLFIGRFLNVAAIRVLKKELNVFHPPHCVNCNHRLGGAELIPVIGYLALKGECRTCQARISPAVPIGEAATALLFAWVGWHFSPSNLEWMAGLLLCSVLIIITYTDLRSMLIPNKVVFTGVALAFLLRMFVHPLPYWNYAAAAVIGFGLLYLLAVVSRGGMGGGDMKLYIFIGLICGIPLTILSLFFACLLGTVFGLFFKWSGRLKPKQPIPFGPFIAVGSFLSFLYGERWIQMYLEWLNL